MRTAWRIAAAAFVAGPLGFGVSSAHALPQCAEIATNYPTSKAKSDNGNSPWKLLQSITSELVPASGPNAAYCRVELKYVREINIRIGLPLSAADGGAGGI